MTSGSRPRKTIDRSTRTPMFEVEQEPLRTPPRPINRVQGLFDDHTDLLDRPARLPIPTSKSSVSAAKTYRPEPESHPEEPYQPEAPRRSMMRDFAELHQASEFALPSYRAAPQGGISVGLPRNLLVYVALIVCSVVIWNMLAAPQKTTISLFNGALGQTNQEASEQPRQAQNTTPGETPVIGTPSISADIIDQVLTKYGSPAQGTGAIWVALGKQYGIDPAYALAFFIHESSAGSNPAWAGLKPGGSTTHNIGNIICAGYATCYGRFRDYPNWQDGIEDWYKLISREYVNGRGANTLETIIPIYAPADDNNNVPNYIQSVAGLVNDWRQGVIR